MTATPTNQQHQAAPTAAIEDGHARPIYEVARASRPPHLTDDWLDGPWRDAVVAKIDHFHPGSHPDDRPQAEAKLLYDEQAVYAQFLVRECSPICRITQRQGNVSQDSCVELFVQPGNGETIGQGYLNFEMNCGGTLLTHHQSCGWARGRQKIADYWLDRIGVHHTLPRRIVRPMPGEVTWRIGLSVPLTLIEAYAGPLGERRPGPGVIWRANLFKCVKALPDKYHWASWSSIGPMRDFHQPGRFGTLKFT